MEAALPLAEEFSEKMTELAGAVPELSRSLVRLTEVRSEGRNGTLCYFLFCVSPLKVTRRQKQNTLGDKPQNVKHHTPMLGIEIRKSVATRV